MLEFYCFFILLFFAYFFIVIISAIQVFIIQSIFMEILRAVYVDSFKIKRSHSIYFLTHWHADHYYGLTTKWTYGPIFCSAITKKILLTKYPKLTNIVYGLQLNQPYILQNYEGTQFQVTMYNSNHIAGSVIILFHIPSPSKYILHTGDMRFNTQTLTTTPALFTRDPQTDTYVCKYKIDTLYLDNTYCDPIFMFPNRSDALKMIKDIIDKWGPGTRKFYLVTDSIGKEEAFIGLSLMYGVKVTLWGERMRYVKEMFTADVVERVFCGKQEAAKCGSWIQVIKRRFVDKMLQEDPRAIAIKLTGWANLQSSHAFSQHEYIVPYSLHSNYQQLELFMSVVRPRVLLPVVRLNHNKSNKFRENIHSYGAYFGSLAHMKQRGFAFFTSNYVDASFTNTNLEDKEDNLMIDKYKQLEGVKMGKFDRAGNWVQGAEEVKQNADGIQIILEQSCLEQRIFEAREEGMSMEQEINQEQDDDSSD